jgi:hypothetical protein
MAILRPYIPEEVVVLYGGYPIDGWNTVTVSYDEAKINATQGSENTIGVTKMPSSVGTVELALQGNSDANHFFNAVLAKQEQETGIPTASMLIEDLTGNTLYECNFCVIETPPSQVLGASHEDNEKTWTFKVLEIKARGLLNPGIATSSSAAIGAVVGSLPLLGQ